MNAGDFVPTADGRWSSSVPLSRRCATTGSWTTRVAVVPDLSGIRRRAPPLVASGLVHLEQAGAGLPGHRPARGDALRCRRADRVCRDLRQRLLRVADLDA